jgi:putative CRISPR-associated protein (TIGR02619 family)
MPKLILVTVGTSALFEHSDWKNGSNGNFWEKPEDLIARLEQEALNNQSTEYNHQKKQVFNALKSNLETYYANNEQGLNTLSAEIASLLAMGKEPSIGNITNDDKIVLLHSDTVDGKLCAEVTAEVIRSHFCSDTMVKPLVGIRVQSRTVGEDIRQIFVNQGLNSLQEEVRRATETFRQEHGEIAPCYFNITGGYKGVLQGK